MHQDVNIENLITKKQSLVQLNSEVSDIANLPLVAKSTSLEMEKPLNQDDLTLKPMQ